MHRSFRNIAESSYLHLAFSLGVFLIAGCTAGDGKPRVALEGRVTLNGKEIPNGLVSLIPSDPTGETAVAMIENGKYVIDSTAGPTPGKYKVLVESQQPTGRKVRDADNPGAKVDELREIVPAKYNVQSTLEIEIGPGSGQTIDLALKGKANEANSRTKR
jgi:hypothetical protein